MDILSITLDKNISIRNYLLENFVSKKKIYELDTKKLISVNNESLSFFKELPKGTVIDIDLSQIEKRDFIPQKMDLDIIYEDRDILIVNKPKNMIIHPDDKRGLNTLVNAVSYYFLQQGLDRNIRYIHRLDKDTTGGIIFTKHFLAQSRMDNDLKNNKIVREYLALVEGCLEKGVINKRIGTDRHINGKMVVSTTGVEAITNYEKIKGNNYFSLLLVKLETGRTHQIRVHLSSIKHPLVGDTLYGGDDFLVDRPMLHSYHIYFTHPFTGKKVNISVSLPKDFQDLVNSI